MIPFITMIFGARIVDMLVAGVDRQEILKIVYIMVDRKSVV